MRLLQLLLMLLVFAPLALTAEDETTTQPTTKTLAWPDGTRYVGGVMDGKRKGKGTIFWQDGTRFVGQFDNDMRNGPGTMILPDGTVYTGFFKNDELVDTERTIAASAKAAAELDNEESAAALQGTELPMEADSLVDRPSATPTQVDENDLLEPVSDPEPAIVQDAAPEPEDDIVAAAATKSESIAEPEPEPGPEEYYYSSDVTDITDSVKDELIETVDLWAAAIIGVIGSLIFQSLRKLNHRLEIDDPLDNSVIHGFCGLWSIVAVGLFDTDMGMIYTGKVVFLGI